LPRLAPVDWKTLECVFLAYGFLFIKQVGSHRTYSKSGCLRPVVIPTYKAVAVDIILANMRTAGLTRERYFKLLEKCR
jgi:predicted RNA binding protein YcfA (HicA-like mRNA interferase family)